MSTRETIDAAREFLRKQQTESVPEILPQVPSIDQIRRLEHEMLARGNQIDQLPITNHFSEGLLGREILIPAGMVLTGREHIEAHFFIVLSGDITVWTEGGMRRLQGGTFLIGKPRTKRVGYAHVDTRCVAIHANPTNETDDRKLISMFTVPEPSELLEVAKCLGDS